MNIDPKFLLGLIGVTGVGGLIGWILKGVIGGAKASAKNELELACEALERAKKTADPKDDIEAEKHYKNVRRLKALVDALPDPPK